MSTPNPGISEPFDLEAIESRASAAPGGDWADLGGSIWIPWYAEDDEQAGPWDTGRYIGVEPGDWHGTDQPPPALWEFLARSRDDVLALVAEVRRLRRLVPPGLVSLRDFSPRHCPLCQVGWTGPEYSRCWIDDRHPGKPGRVIGLGLAPAASAA